jgi:hypothetical protein
MEQAAQIADNYANRNHVSLNIAAAIRALSDTPPGMVLVPREPTPAKDQTND